MSDGPGSPDGPGVSAADLWPKIEALLPGVERPTRYIDREWGAVPADSSAEVSFLLAYPDVYEVGMPNLGLQILYAILNGHEWAAAERVFMPWPDMEEAMRAAGVPLFSLESSRPAVQFDCLGFSLQHELSYTNVLAMLDLAGVPVLAADRGPGDPLVVGGGPCAFNPEPMADFFDLFVLGDGESAIADLAAAVREWKRSCSSDGGGRSESDERPTLLKALAGKAGLYVPSLYEPAYAPDGSLTAVAPVAADVPVRVTRRVEADLDKAPRPARPLVPYMNVVHDRCSLEVMRGCSRGCRFCQAGMVYRPVRERSAELVLATAGEALACTGYDELSLTSLSTSDYTPAAWVLPELACRYEGTGLSISLPSLRSDGFSVGLADAVSHGRRTGLTFAPEAGTQRLRDVINKQVTEADLEATVEAAVQAGWRRLKFYFMLGLPTETDQDVDAIAALLRRLTDLALSKVPGRERGRVTFTASLSPFAPKPHTPFQWTAQESKERVEEKIARVKATLKGRHVAVKWHDARMTALEGVLARGDRRVGRAILAAWHAGAQLDSWSEHLRFDLWEAAFDETGIDAAWYAERARDKDEVLPWDHLDSGLDRDWLWAEYERARCGELTDDCRTGTCSDCGVCPALGIDPMYATDAPEPRGAAPSATHEPETTPRQPRGRPRRMVEREQCRAAPGDEASAVQTKVRLKLGKRGRLRFLSHLEFAGALARAMRRAAVPVALSAGFSPRPLISYGPALGVGVASEAELADVCLTEEVEPAELRHRLERALPTDLPLLDLRIIGEGEPKLGKLVRAAAYRIGCPLTAPAERSALDAALEALTSESEVELPGRTPDSPRRRIDPRRAIVSAGVTSSDETSVTVDVVLRVGEKDSFRPEQVAGLFVQRMGGSVKEVDMDRPESDMITARCLAVRTALLAETAAGLTDAYRAP